MFVRAKYPPFLILVISGLITYLSLIFFDFDIGLMNFFMRSTGLAAFFLFNLSFGISSIHYFLKKPITKWILKRRKAFGLTSAALFCIHFSLIATKSVILGDKFNPEPELLPVLAILSVLTMAITSIPSVIKMLGTFKWKALHQSCGIMISTYLINFYFIASSSVSLAYACLVIILVCILVLKIFMYIHKVYLRRSFLMQRNRSNQT